LTVGFCFRAVETTAAQPAARATNAPSQAAQAIRASRDDRFAEGKLETRS